ncbi:helix-turn-helix transcriptional regulator [Bacillus pumilus]
MNKEEFRDLLKQSRFKLGFSQQDVVEESRTGITRQYYSYIENAERTPSVSLAKDLARVLQLDWTIFFEIESNKKLHKE